MNDPYRPLRRSLSRQRLLTGLALLALQGAIAASPLWEPQREGWMQMHVEQDGAHHIDPHNGAACELCAARAQLSMPAPVAEPFALSRPCIAAAKVTYAERSRDDAPGNFSRAPPALPA
jgi:hypothetical protein